MRKPLSGGFLCYRHETTLKTMKKTLLLSCLTLLLGCATSLKAQEFLFDFEDGTYQYWTCIDADGDEDCWWIIEQQFELTGHNKSQYFAISASYNSPDNYFVAPDKDYYSKISIWACSDSEYFEEHFGVAVSTTDQYSPDAYTIIKEWTITAEDGTKDQGPWREYTADLSAYAGQEIWVAIRHFNCNQHILFLDDITLTYDLLSIGEDQADNGFTLYPNPVNDKFTVESEQVINHYEVYNILGEKVASSEVNATLFEVNANELPQGVYFIRLHSDGMIQTKKFTKGS